jgi:hypothetical protein
LKAVYEQNKRDIREIDEYVKVTESLRDEEIAVRDST